MSNFIQSIQINNLNKKVNALATEVSNIIVGGAPVISGDIDMNNNSISEIDQLIFNSGRALIDENGTLNFNNENIIGESQLANYQAKVSSDNLDMNNFSLFNVNGFQVVDNTNGGTTKDFTLINGGLVSNNGNDVRLYLYVNESLEFPTNLDFHLYPLRNVGSIEFQNGGTLTSTDNSSVLFNGNELAAYTMTNDFNGVNQYALRQIANLTLTSGGGLLFGGVQNKLVPDADDDSTLLYQNIPIITASNISDYFPAPVFVPEATSSLNMGNYNITNTNGLVSQYVGTNSINFNNDPSKKLTVLNGDLQYQGSNVITASDLSSYLPAQEFISTATADLNMSNFAVRDAGVGEFSAINFAGNPNYHLSATADGLLYNGVALPTTTDIEINSIIFHNIDAKQNLLTNCGGIGFGGGNDPQNLETTQLTMNPDGDLLWNDFVILNEANSNVQPAPQVYSVSDWNSLLTSNITITADSCNFFSGIAVGSNFCVKFEALATNIGGADPAWVSESQSITIVYAASDSAYENFYFDATNAGVYFAIQFSEKITDSILVKFEKYNNK